MEIVGIDFGTTNVRISTWDPDDPNAGLPQPRLIGRGDTNLMPVVVALRRVSDGEVTVTVGEDADVLEDGAQYPGHPQHQALGAVQRPLRQVAPGGRRERLAHLVEP